MKRRSPTLEGFKAVFRQPSHRPGRDRWRWSLGSAGIALFMFTFIEYLDTLPVTPLDTLLLRTRYPVLVGQALAHILRGSALRLVEAGILLGLGFAVAWMVVASLGRAATLKALLGDFAGTIFQSKSLQNDRENPGACGRWLGSTHFGLRQLWLRPSAVWAPSFWEAQSHRRKIPRPAALCLCSSPSQCWWCWPGWR